jgi:formylglycine-generating enzyme required for sulfatase activity
MVGAEEAKQVKIIASVNRSLFPLPLTGEYSGMVIRSAEELASTRDRAVQKKLEAELAEHLGVPRIDWSKQMLLAVIGPIPGPKPNSSGYLPSAAINFDPPQIHNKTLIVTWKEEPFGVRFPGQHLSLALVERFDGEVKFVPRVLEITNSIGMKLVRIPAGTFSMGSPKDEENRGDDEQLHEVEITRPFYLGKHEVTFSQFRAFVKDTKYLTEAEKDGKGGRAFDGKEFIQKPEFTWKNLHFAQSDDQPVCVVSWNDAVAFCAWLSKKEGTTYRLPTEAEWEYACRAGTKTRFNTGAKDVDLKVAGNIADASLKTKWKEVFWNVEWDDGFPYTAPVGKFRANVFGLHDMHGNVWEWCSDWYGEDYYRKSPKQDPHGPASGKLRVSRGGAWSTQPKFCRSAFRDWHEPGYRSDCVGFRVVMERTGQ